MVIRTKSKGSFETAPPVCQTVCSVVRVFSSSNSLQMKFRDRSVVTRYTKSTKEPAH